MFNGPSDDRLYWFCDYESKQSVSKISEKLDKPSFKISKIRYKPNSKNQ